MTDQTQTTTEPVDSSHGSVYDQLLTLIHDRDHALRGDERTDPNEIDETVLEIMRITTPQPLAIGLDREVRERLTQHADGKSPYKTWRGEAPAGEPTLKRDLRSLLAICAAILRASAAEGAGT